MEYIVIIFVIIAVINSFSRAAKKKADAERKEAERRAAQRRWQQQEQPADMEGGGYAAPAWRAEDSNYTGAEWQMNQPAAASAAPVGDYNMPTGAEDQPDFDDPGMVFEQDVKKHEGHSHQGYAYVNKTGMYEGKPLPKRSVSVIKQPSAPLPRAASALAQPALLKKLSFDGNSVVQGVIYAELLTRVTPGLPPYMRNR
jgi:hypothetical protein